MTDAREVLSALIDGEEVDAEVVADLLEVPANRALLAEFLRLRASVKDDEAPVPEWRDDAVVPSEAAGFGRRAWLRAAAVFALLTAGALGGTWIQDYVTRERPPEPTRVVQLQLVETR